MKQYNKIKRNIIIYVIGGVITATGNGAGGLAFIIGPILMMVILRLFGGDGWIDAGLKDKSDGSLCLNLLLLYIRKISD